MYVPRVNLAIAFYNLEFYLYMLPATEAEQSKTQLAAGGRRPLSLAYKLLKSPVLFNNRKYPSKSLDFRLESRRSPSL